MNFLFFFIECYVAVLLFRLIMTQQELTFNSIGKIIARLTNPIFAIKGKSKADTDPLIPLFIALLTLAFGLLISVTGGSLFYIIIAFQKMLKFLATFFIISVFLGAMASPTTGAFPLYFYRLGNIFVKPARKILPLKGNLIVIPAVIIVMVLFIAINSALVLLSVILDGANFNIVGIIWKNFLLFLTCIVDIMGYMSGAVIIRALLSWVSPDPRNMIVQFIFYVTEPILAPLRKVIPPIGMLDLSAFVAIFGLMIAQQFLRQLIASMQGFL
ncbi:MAG: YggT family protein [Deferribacteraceae bacterium]|nr:YggT family protein [Deferribacteraceae bacterium]